MASITMSTKTSMNTLPNQKYRYCNCQFRQNKKKKQIRRPRPFTNYLLNDFRINQHTHIQNEIDFSFFFFRSVRIRSETNKVEWAFPFRVFFFLSSFSVEAKKCLCYVWCLIVDMCMFHSIKSNNFLPISERRENLNF